jgi:hypothetical protein
LDEAERQIDRARAGRQGRRNCAPSNDSKQPQHEDQDQQTAKTDIHATSSILALAKQPPTEPRRSNRSGSVSERLG